MRGITMGPFHAIPETDTMPTQLSWISLSSWMDHSRFKFLIWQIHLEKQKQKPPVRIIHGHYKNWGTNQCLVFYWCHMSSMYVKFGNKVRVEVPSRKRCDNKQGLVMAKTGSSGWLLFLLERNLGSLSLHMSEEHHNNSLWIVCK